MIDYLFLSPLGWNKQIWKKIVDNKKIQNKDYEIMEFLDNSFKKITKSDIYIKLDNYLNKLSNRGIIVSSSFGSVVLINYLIDKELTLKNKIIIIDGFETIPKKDLLIKNFESIPNIFHSSEEYYNSILTPDEKEDKILLDILKYNLTYKNKTYHTILSNQSAVNYLSIFSSIDFIKQLLIIVPRINNLILFSSIELPVKYYKISSDDHLLMITNPQLLLDNL